MPGVSVVLFAFCPLQLRRQFNAVAGDSLGHINSDFTLVNVVFLLLGAIWRVLAIAGSFIVARVGSLSRGDYRERRALPRYQLRITCPCPLRLLPALAVSLPAQYEPPPPPPWV
jgi:hypothetical protein